MSSKGICIAKRYHGLCQLIDTSACLIELHVLLKLHVLLLGTRLGLFYNIEALRSQSPASSLLYQRNPASCRRESRDRNKYNQLFGQSLDSIWERRQHEATIQQNLVTLIQIIFQMKGLHRVSQNTISIIRFRRIRHK